TFGSVGHHATPVESVPVGRSRAAVRDELSAGALISAESCGLCCHFVATPCAALHAPGSPDEDTRRAWERRERETLESRAHLGTDAQADRLRGHRRRETLERNEAVGWWSMDAPPGG